MIPFPLALQQFAQTKAQVEKEAFCINNLVVTNALSLSRARALSLSLSFALALSLSESGRYSGINKAILALQQFSQEKAQVEKEASKPLRAPSLSLSLSPSPPDHITLIDHSSC